MSGQGREYAGMSSEKEGEKPSRRKPKVSWGRLVRPGLVGPKPRLKSVGDGHPVNIPELFRVRYYSPGAHRSKVSPVMVVRV